MRNPRQWWQARRAVWQARDEALVAGALWHQAPLSSFPLMVATQMSVGRLYAALRRMENDGRVESWWQLGQQPGQPRRRVYRLGAPPCGHDFLGRAMGGGRRHG